MKLLKRDKLVHYSTIYFRRVGDATHVWFWAQNTWGLAYNMSAKSGKEIYLSYESTWCEPIDYTLK